MQELTVQVTTGEMNVPTILGPQGIGKTAISVEIAYEVGHDWFRINVGDADDPTSITGVPVPRGILEDRTIIIAGAMQDEATEDLVSKGFPRNKAVKKIESMVWALNSSAAAACDHPCTLLFDDIDKASGAIAKGLIGLFGSRTFRDFKLHSQTRLMCAGNRAGDDILGEDLSESILGRITIYEMTANVHDFAEYARREDSIDESIIGFLLANDKHLHRQLEPGELASPSPRSWKQASDHKRVLGLKGKAVADIIGRKCGKATSKEWVAWTDVLSKVDSKEILETGALPDASGQFVYAACYAVAHYVNKTKTFSKTWKGFEKFVNTLPSEMRMAFLVQLRQSKINAAVKAFPGLGSLLLGKIVGDAST